MDLTPDGRGVVSDSSPGRRSHGAQSVALHRSQTDPSTGLVTSNGTVIPLQQVNAITSYLDLSQVYGSDQATADALRTMSGGLLKTSPGNDAALRQCDLFHRATS